MRPARSPSLWCSPHSTDPRSARASKVCTPTVDGNGKYATVVSIMLTVKKSTSSTSAPTPVVHTGAKTHEPWKEHVKAGASRYRLAAVQTAGSELSCTVQNPHGTLIAHSTSRGKNTVVTCIVAKDALFAGVGGSDSDSAVQLDRRVEPAARPLNEGEAGLLDLRAARPSSRADRVRWSVAVEADPAPGLESRFRPAESCSPKSLEVVGGDVPRADRLCPPVTGTFTIAVYSCLRSAGVTGNVDLPDHDRLVCFPGLHRVDRHHVQQLEVEETEGWLGAMRVEVEAPPRAGSGRGGGGVLSR